MEGAEGEWIRGLEAAEPARRARALAAFARQYHWFSLHQILAFSRIFALVPATDRESLAELGGVLFDELGQGDPGDVHSVVFERFAAGVGVDVATELPLPDEDVLPALRSYVDGLVEAFSTDLAAAAGAYRFLERSAVESYQPLLGAFRRIGLPEHALEFFALHAELEPTHLAKADALVARVLDDGQQEVARRTGAELARRWDRVWSELAQHTSS